MKLQLTKSFSHPSSPRPFLAGELLDVPEATAREWIAEGKAIEFAGGNATESAHESFHLNSESHRGPRRQRDRETAVKVL